MIKLKQLFLPLIGKKTSVYACGHYLEDLSPVFFSPGTMRSTALAVLLLALDTSVVEGGGGYGASSHGPLLGDVKAFRCRPEVHYVTHYRTKFQDVGYRL